MTLTVAETVAKALPGMRTQASKRHGGLRRDRGADLGAVFEFWCGALIGMTGLIDLCVGLCLIRARLFKVSRDF